MRDRPVRHGTVAGYTIDRCRCAPCTTAATRYSKCWRLHQVSGQPPLLVDVTPVQEHVNALLAEGMSFRAIALAAGYRSRNSLVSALAARRIRRQTAERILAVTAASDTRPARYVDATGSRRRLQALAVMGWPSRDLAARMGARDHSTVLDIQSGKLTTVRQSTVDAVRALFDALWDESGPSTRTRSMAVKRGWQPPLAWDDETMDDPAAGPADAAEPSMSRRDILVEDFRDTWPSHLGDVRAAAMRLGVTHAALSQALARARRDGVEVSFHNVYRGGRTAA